MVKSLACAVLCFALVGCESAAMLDPSGVGGYSDAARPADSKQVGTAISQFSNENRGRALDGLATQIGHDSAAPENVSASVETIQRQVIYSANLRVVVVSTADAMNSVQSFAKDAGGYLQESDSTSIIIRVPAAKFDETVKRIATLGEIVDRQVRASDVTDQYQDIEIRLDNAKKTRERLMAHLAKSEKMEDTIKIEAEISRVSVEIESLEGKMRLMQSQIALSTIRVELNSTQPKSQGGPTATTPFDWIGRLGDGLVAGNTETMPRQPRLFAGGPKFDPPAGFVRYYSTDALVEAMDADGVRIKLQKQANFDKAPIEFWQKLARKALVEGRAISVSREGPIDGDLAWQSVVGSREVAGQTYGYLLVVSRTNDDVYTFEAWAPKAAFDARLAELIRSAKSLRK